VQCSPGGDDDKQCNDQKEKNPKCPGGEKPDKGKTTEKEAYSNPLEKYSKITFCNRFFNSMTSLGIVIKNAKKNPRAYQDDLWRYQNRARVVFHEITHLYYFMNSPDKSPYVDDVKIQYGSKKSEVNVPSYGPENIKILANYEAVGKGGFYTQRNGIATLFHTLLSECPETRLTCSSSGFVRLVCNGEVYREGNRQVCMNRKHTKIFADAANTATSSLKIPRKPC
jgi:hypothetical protein